MSQRNYQKIDSLQLAELLRQGVELIDLRRPDEWLQTGVIAGSRLLTFFDAQGQSEPEAWLAQLGRRESSEEPIALICRSGYRSALVGDFLCQCGVPWQIFDVTDGILGWLANGLPVQSVLRRGELG